MSIDVTSDMIYAWICRLKEKNISFIVAPYEADAQLGKNYLKIFLFLLLLNNLKSLLLSFNHLQLIFLLFNHLQLLLSVNHHLKLLL